MSIIMACIILILIQEQHTQECCLLSTCTVYCFSRNLILFLASWYDMIWETKSTEWWTWSPTSRYIISYYIISYDISYHIPYIIKYHIILYHIINHILSYHIIYHIIIITIIITISYPNISYHVISYHIIRYDIIS